VGGSLQRRISDVAAQRLRKIARRQAAVTGVSSYPNLDEAPLETAPEERRELRRRAEAPADVLPDPVREEVAGLRDALASPAPGTGEIEALGRALEQSAPLAAVTEVLAERGEVVRAERLATWRDAEPFEELRDRAERWRDEHGREPEVFVAAVGQLARLKPRIDFTANLLAAGGLRARVPETCFADAGEAVEAFADSGVPLAALVAADDDYPDLVPALAPALRRQGARAVLLAGRPGDREQAFREAGVDEFAFLGCDALEVLHRLLGRLEVS
jgi:methylmalonyl-CoA mutase